MSSHSPVAPVGPQAPPAPAAPRRASALRRARVPPVDYGDDLAPVAKSVHHLPEHRFTLTPVHTEGEGGVGGSRSRDRMEEVAT
jgi:hypothetical protein